MRADVLAMAGTNLSDVPIKFPVLLGLGCRLLLEVLSGVARDLSCRPGKEANFYFLRKSQMPVGFFKLK